jgi:hypothetical protein
MAVRRDLIAVTSACKPDRFEAAAEDSGEQSTSPLTGPAADADAVAEAEPLVPVVCLVECPALLHPAMNAADATTPHKSLTTLTPPRSPDTGVEGSGAVRPLRVEPDRRAAGTRAVGATAVRSVKVPNRPLIEARSSAT